jgi:hypothetical protein
MTGLKIISRLTVWHLLLALLYLWLKNVDVAFLIIFLYNHVLIEVLMIDDGFRLVLGAWIIYTLIDV